VRAWAAKRYELRAEVYTYKFLGQDPDSGSPIFDWDTDNPEVVKATGGSVKPYQTLEDFGADYKNSQMIALFMPYRPTLRDRVGKVKNRAGEVLFKEVNGDPTVFDVYGVFPQIDSNGRTIDYQVICVRGAIQ